MLTRRSPAAARSCGQRAEASRRWSSWRGRRPRRGQLLDEHREVGPHGRLAAGEADAVEAEALDEHPGDALDLLEGQQLGAGQPLIPSAGMQYVQRKLQRSVTEIRRSRTVRPNGSTRRRSRLRLRGHDRSPREQQARRPSPPAPRRRRRRAARPARWPRPSRASWCEPWPPAERTWHRPSCADVGRSTRTKCILPSGRRRRPRRRPRASRAGRGRRRGPSSGAAPGGRTARSDTSDDTGLPGRPNTGVRRPTRAEGERLGRPDGDLHPAHVADARRAPPSRSRSRPCSRRRW